MEHAKLKGLVMRTSWSRSPIQSPIQKYRKCTEGGPRI